MRVSLDGATIAKLISASGDSLGAFKFGRSYDLVRVHLIKVGCPRELAASKDNSLNMPLVIERNRRHYGTIQATGYYPKAVVVAGAYRRSQLLARGVLDAWGWVERGSLEIQADDAISCGELTEKLNHLLQVKFYGDNRPICGQPWPYICQVYPFENYLIYEFAGQKYRQAYALDAVEREVKLTGDSVKVEEKFVDACGVGLPRTQSGMRQVCNPLSLAGNHVVSYPHAGADLIRMVIRNTANVDKVVSKLVDAIKFGLYKPMKPDFAPVNLSDDGKILKPLVEARISPADFVVWADKNGGDFMDCREFSDKVRKKLAKRGAALPDGSYPILTKNDLRNAVQSFGRSPDRATKAHIIKRARALGATDLLPEKWKVSDIKSFGKFHSTKKHDVGNQKTASFRV
jgi:hypothetical protein